MITLVLSFVKDNLAIRPQQWEAAHFMKKRPRFP